MEHWNRSCDCGTALHILRSPSTHTENTHFAVKLNKPPVQVSRFRTKKRANNKSWNVIAELKAVDLRVLKNRVLQEFPGTGRFIENY